MIVSNLRIIYDNNRINVVGIKDDYITNYIMNSQKFYEEEILQRTFKALVDNNQFKGNDIFIDVGAFIGLHTIFFNLFGKFNHFILIEPNKDLEYILKDNLKKNLLISDYAIWSGYALGRKRGWVNMKLKSSDNLGTNRISLKGRKVKLETLDYLLKHEILKNLALIKIDTEGTEYDVLIGAKGILKKFKPALLLESWDIAEFFKDFRFGMLKKLDYKVEFVMKNLNEDNWNILLMVTK
jgi:FkbM family methyltransferase